MKTPQQTIHGVLMRTSSTSIAALAVAIAIGITGIAAAAAEGPTQVTVEPAATLAAGTKAPFDAPGVRAIGAASRSRPATC
jgi:uncharacterized membrane protein